uniref:WD_REPEATS_REGION domain-containing protein n=1 Tax=Heterorhabditis bacteriophora TaxID=37862 RepID=A0A1I7XBM4_HETBA
MEYKTTTNITLAGHLSMVTEASVAQSAARQSHNLKVVSSSLTGSICFYEQYTLQRSVSRNLFLHSAGVCGAASAGRLSKVSEASVAQSAARQSHNLKVVTIS